MKHGIKFSSQVQESRDMHSADGSIFFITQVFPLARVSLVCFLTRSKAPLPPLFLL